MREFVYHRPLSLAEAERLFAASAEGRYLSGGMTLIPTMKQGLATPVDLVDLGRLPELKMLLVEDGYLVVGAATTHTEVQTSPIVADAIPALADLAGQIGDPHVRHRGTIGGSIANNDPAADYPAAVLALGATIETSRRTLPAEEFFQGMFSTALEEGEIVTRIRFPIPERAAYRKFSNPASRYAMAGVFVAMLGDGEVRVAVTGAGQDGVFRASEMEDALSAELNPAEIEAIVVDPATMLSDLHGSAAYRANLVKVMAKRAVADLLA
ncbi:carbon monoxide dehydrogenase [Kaistia algarum]|uniref:FAD binding domain-containing protein n=1 Tax=Kaistia algarum TaxID=2083279 RepID=UPI000CE90C64|nr:xanthine dehydrogenase family protein subunit M [Kaistia algarum]MCX5516670.1 xanthine dehydrogenase family protein subunit M [Kaistia algarum]PPE78572.1 carbon monoxide dehydrogenase [Kaistia algarum]